MTLGEKALDQYPKNESWKEYYEKAPSDACKRCIEGEFVRSLFQDYGSEYDKDKLEATLDLEDWRWLYKWCGNNPRKGLIAEKIAELEAAAKQP